MVQETSKKIASTEVSDAADTSKIASLSLLESEATYFFHRKERERIPGRREEVHYEPDDRKLESLQRFGWFVQDSDARTYSAKFKPQKR